MLAISVFWHNLTAVPKWNPFLPASWACMSQQLMQPVQIKGCMSRRRQLSEPMWSCLRSVSTQCSGHMARASSLPRHSLLIGRRALVTPVLVWVKTLSRTAISSLRCSFVSSHSNTNLHSGLFDFSLCYQFKSKVEQLYSKNNLGKPLAMCTRCREGRRPRADQ